jgi:SAM-dependent methyltransferase
MRMADDFLTKWRRELHPEYYEKSEPVTDTETYDELIELILAFNPTYVLDIGTGDGYIVDRLWEHGISAVGTTICYEDTRQYVIYEDMHDLEFKDGSFDVVVAKHILEHALSPRLAIREAWRVLRPDGLFLVETPINEVGIEPWGGNCAHFYCFTPRQWESLVEKNGFRIDRREFSGSSFRMICYKDKMEA